MESLDSRVVDAVRGIGGVEILVLFGSRAVGRGRPGSDLDLAVLPTDEEPTARRRLLSALAVAAADLAPDGRVDVVFLDETTDLLRQRIIAGGRLLICRDPALWRAWRVRTMREFGDREPVRRLMRRAQRRRLEGGGNSSGRSGRALGSLGRTGRLPR